MGRATHQFNPGAKGATTLGEWMQAVGAITPHDDRGDRGLVSDMPVADAVAIIRATSAAKRREFAAALGRHGYTRRASKKSAEWWAENPAASYTLHPQYRDSKHEKWAHTGHKEQRVTGTLTDAQRAARDFVSSMAGKEAIERPHMTEREFRVKVSPEGSYDEAAIVGQPRRVNSQTRKRSNLFGFGGKKKKTAVKRSSMTVSSASSAAYKAGQQSGDTGQFLTWAESKGLSDRGPWLRKSYDKGVNDGEKSGSQSTGRSGQRYSDRPITSKPLADVSYKGYRIYHQGEGFRTSADRGESEFDDVKQAKRFIDDELKMRRNPSTPAAEQAASQRFLAQAQTARLAGDLTRASSLERLARSRAAMAMVLKGERPNPQTLASIQARISDLVDQINLKGNTRSKAERLRRLKEQRDALEGMTELNPGFDYYVVAGGSRQYFKSMDEANRAAQAEADATGKPTARQDSRGGKSLFYPKRRNLRNRKRSNPLSDSDAAYESFHGQPVGETVLLSEDVHEHEHLWTLGLLMQIRVDSLSGFECLIDFEDDPPYLCSSEDGKQLYIEAGDQKLDLKALKLDGAEWQKDRMVIGQLSAPGKDRAGKPVKWNLGYQTEKDFDKFETILYQHDLGEETGVRPLLEYEPRNEKLYISGGQYKIKLPLFGTSPGIEN